MSAFGKLSVALSKAFQGPAGGIAMAVSVSMSVRGRYVLTLDGPADFSAVAGPPAGPIVGGGRFVWQGVTFETDCNVPDLCATVQILGEPFATVNFARKPSVGKTGAARK